MGSLSFGISELIKESTENWFKLLSAEEGEFYNIRIPPEDEDEVESLRKKMLELSSTQKKKSNSQKSISTNIILNNSNKDVVKASDFNFLTVLGKGSFGKVSIL